MNVFEKLNLARIQFQQANKKMSGKNSYAGYSYYELADILPEVNMICNNIKAVCIVRYEKDMAFLDFVDCEKPEDTITFSSPMSEANLKGCHAVQNLGAVETYVKRYLYQACFEIVENDALDGTMNPNQKAQYQSAQQNQTPQNQQIQQNQPRPQNPQNQKVLDLGKKISDFLKLEFTNGNPVFTKEEVDEWRAASNDKFKAKDADGLEEIFEQLKQVVGTRINRSASENEQPDLQEQAQIVANAFDGPVF